MKKLLGKLMAVAMVAILGITMSGSVKALAGPNVPTGYKSVAPAKNYVYQINTDGHTYSTYIFTPSPGECVALKITGSYDHNILVSVYSDVTGYVTSFPLSVADGGVYYVRPGVSSSVYFLFENTGNTTAIAQYQVFSD